MKKLLRAMLLVFLSMVLIFGSVTSVWGLHVIDKEQWEKDQTEKIIKTEYGDWSVPVFQGSMTFGDWYEAAFASGDYSKIVAECAKIWYLNYTFEDAKIWDQRYLEYYEPIFKKLSGYSSSYSSSSWVSAVNLQDFSWNGRTLTVDVAVDTNIKHTKEYNSQKECWYYDDNVGYHLVNTVVITEKATGKVVDMGATGYYEPQFADWYNKSHLAEDAPEDAVLEYSSNADTISTIRMHQDFDPAIHDITLYITSINYNYRKPDLPFTVSPTEDSYEGYNYKVIFNAVIPIDASECTFIFGDANGDDKFNLHDISHIMQKTAGWELEFFDTKSADVNYDGAVNLEDAQFGIKMVAGWDMTKE